MHYSFKSTPTTTFKSRTQTVTKSNKLSSIPGPGYYDANKPLPKSTSLAKTTQKRQLWKFQNEAPGPGSYQLKSFTTSGPQRSMSAKLIKQEKITPGPFDYNTDLSRTKAKAPIFTMGAKSKSSLKIINQHNLYKPDPTKYESKSTFNTSAGLIFGSSNRRDLTETQKTPGPNLYKTQNITLNSQSHPRCIVGGQKRQLKIAVFQSTPGPGTYQNINFFQQNNIDKKGYTCRGKVRNLIAEELGRNPAPGQYKSQILKFKNTAPQCATSLSKRKTFIDDVQKAKKDLPSFSKSQVNFFNSSKFRSSSASEFGRSRRKDLDQNQKTPGPVAYQGQKLKVLNKQPSYSGSKSQIKNQFLKPLNPEHPGPGLYDFKLDFVKQGRGSIIVMRQNRPNFDKEKKKPGPGYYNLVKQHQPKFGFTNQKRVSFTDLGNQAKYGVHYNLNTNFVNPPSYMQVTSKVNFSPRKSLGSTGF